MNHWSYEHLLALILWALAMFYGDLVIRKTIGCSKTPKNVEKRKKGGFHNFFTTSFMKIYYTSLSAPWPGFIVMKV